MRMLAVFLVLLVTGCASQSPYIGRDEGEPVYIPRTTAWIERGDADCVDSSDPQNNLCMIKAECIEGSCVSGFGTKRALDENLIFRGYWSSGGGPIGLHDVEFNGEKYQAIFCDYSDNTNKAVYNPNVPPWKCKARESITQGFVRFNNAYYVGRFSGSTDAKTPNILSGGRYIKKYEPGKKWSDQESVPTRIVWDSGVSIEGPQRIESTLIAEGSSEYLVRAYSHLQPEPFFAVFIMDIKTGILGEPEFMTKDEMNAIARATNKNRWRAHDEAKRSTLAWKLRKSFNVTKLARLTGNMASAASSVSQSMPSVDQTFAEHNRTLRKIALKKNFEQANQTQASYGRVGAPQQNSSGNTSAVSGSASSGTAASSRDRQAVGSEQLADGRVGAPQQNSSGNTPAASGSASSGTAASSRDRQAAGREQVAASQSSARVCAGPFNRPETVIEFSGVHLPPRPELRCPEGTTPIAAGSAAAGYPNFLHRATEMETLSGPGEPWRRRITYPSWDYECLCDSGKTTGSSSTQQ